MNYFEIINLVIAINKKISIFGFKILNKKQNSVINFYF